MLLVLALQKKQADNTYKKSNDHRTDSRFTHWFSNFGRCRSTGRLAPGSSSHESKRTKTQLVSTHTKKAGHPAHFAPTSHLAKWGLPNKSGLWTVNHGPWTPVEPKSFTFSGELINGISDRGRKVTPMYIGTLVCGLLSTGCEAFLLGCFDLRSLHRASHCDRLHFAGIEWHLPRPPHTWEAAPLININDHSFSSMVLLHEFIPWRNVPIMLQTRTQLQ